MKRNLIPLLLIGMVLVSGCHQDNKPIPDDGRGLSNEYEIVVIDHCQYIYMGANQSQAITHKGNCNNPKHKLK